MDELATVIQTIIRPRFTEDAQALSEARRIANAVRAYLESDGVVERALIARYNAAGSVWPEAVSEGMQRVERMIMEKTLAVLNAAGGKP